MAAPFHVSTCNVQGLWFLHISYNTSFSMNFLNIFIEFIIVDCFFFLSVILNSLVILLSFCIHYFRWEVCWNHIVSPLRMFPWVVFKIFLYLCPWAVWLWCYQVRFLKSCLGFFEHLGSVSQCFWPYLENPDHYFFKCIFLPYSFPSS